MSRVFSPKGNCRAKDQKEKQKDSEEKNWSSGRGGKKGQRKYGAGGEKGWGYCGKKEVRGSVNRSKMRIV